MSKAAKKFRTWDSYVKEATRPPFELPVDEEKVILVQNPNGEQLMEAAKMAAEGDPEKQLRVICGDAADEIVALVKKAPGEAMGLLVTDIMKHFGYDLDDLGEDSASTT